MARISSLDPGYIAGDLSVFPSALDTTDTLYQVANNAETVTTQGVTYNASFIVVDDATKFPSQGLIRVGTETVYYASRTDTTFKGLIRGFSGSRQNTWVKGTTVANAVLAETHNALKDAIIKIETDLGLKTNPDANSLNGILTAQENRFLAPKPLFRAFPTSGAPPLTVKFQNFSGGDPIRFLWDFGDGSTSVELNPTHTYLAEGNYTVQLNMITSLGAQGIIIKENYINVGHNLKQDFFYATPLVGNTSTVFTLIDQSDGDIANRYWIFDDGTFEVITDPDIHTVQHTYTTAGSYEPSLIIVFTDDTKKRILLGDHIVVS